MLEPNQVHKNDTLYPTKIWKNSPDKLFTEGKGYTVKESPYFPNGNYITTDVGSTMFLPEQPKLDKMFSLTPMGWDDE